MSSETPRPGGSLPAETRLTQYGELHPFGAGFRDGLRPEIGETELSLILGQVDADAASVLVTRYMTPGRACRCTTVGALEQRGFRVRYSPAKRGNRLHVSVYPPMLESGEPAEWDEKMAELFNECFTDELGGGGHGE